MTDKKILRISDRVNNITEGQISNDGFNDPDLGFKMWGGKDHAGGVTRWLAKDKKAQVENIKITALAGSGSSVIGVDASGNVVRTSGGGGGTNWLTESNHTITLAGAGSNLENGTAYINAYNEAKTLTPSVSNQITIEIAPGTVMQFATQFVMDTEYIHTRCRKGSSRSQWSKPPLWTEVTRAGARFYVSGAGTTPAVKITAQHVRITGVDFASVNSGGTPLYGLEIDLNIGGSGPAAGPAPILENCSAAGKGIKFTKGNSCYCCFNTHVEGSFDEYAEGYFERCSGSGSENFKWAGKTYPTLIKECLFVSSPVAADSELDDVIFDDCDIYGMNIFSAQDASS